MESPVEEVDAEPIAIQMMSRSQVSPGSVDIM